jgi:hypothetical protein
MTPTYNPLPAVGLAKFTSQFDLWYSGHGVDAHRHQASQPADRDLWLGRVAPDRMESETIVGASVSYAITRRSPRVSGQQPDQSGGRFYFANDPNQRPVMKSMAPPIWRRDGQVLMTERPPG